MSGGSIHSRMTTFSPAPPEADAVDKEVKIMTDEIEDSQRVAAQFCSYVDDDNNALKVKAG